METQIDNKPRLLFNESLQLTGIIEYGIQWDQLITGQTALPPQGTRFDITFEGSFEGPEIAGTIKGTDYLTVRADGRFMLDIYATITTDDGEQIPIYEEGVVTLSDDGMAKLQLNMKFNTVSPKYAWLNKMQVWGLGRIDMSRGEVNVQAYTGDFYEIPATV